MPRTLREADITKASVLVLTSDDDLGNLNAALAATELNPNLRIVIRMFDQELGVHIPQLFTDAVALSSSALAAPGFVSAAIDGEAGSRFRLAGRLLSSRSSSDPQRGVAEHPDRPAPTRPDRRDAAGRGRDRPRPHPRRRRRDPDRRGRRRGPGGARPARPTADGPGTRSPGSARA